MVHEKTGIGERSTGILQHKGVKNGENDFSVNHGVRVDFREVGVAEIRRACESPPVVEIREGHIGQRPVHSSEKTIGEGGDINDLVHFLTQNLGIIARAAELLSTAEHVFHSRTGAVAKSAVSPDQAAYDGCGDL